MTHLCRLHLAHCQRRSHLFIYTSRRAGARYQKRGTNAKGTRGDVCADDVSIRSFLIDLSTKGESCQSKPRLAVRDANTAEDTLCMTMYGVICHFFIFSSVRLSFFHVQKTKNRHDAIHGCFCAHQPLLLYVCCLSLCCRMY